MQRIEAALELAIATLSEVAKSGSPDEQIKASTVLLTAVKEEREWELREALAAAILPVLETLGGNLAGNLEEDTPVGLALNLTPLEQGNLLLQLGKILDL
jgi:hypothetical protein